MLWFGGVTLLQLDNVLLQMGFWIVFGATFSLN